MENKQLIKMISENGTELRAMYTCFLDNDKNEATVKTERGILLKFIAEPLAFKNWKWVKSTHTEDGCFAIISSMNTKFVLHVLKVIVQYCFENVSTLILSTS